MPEYSLERLAERLKKARYDAGYETKQSAADASGVSVYSITEYEAGRNAPKAENIYQLALCYHVSSDWILGLDLARSNTQATSMDEMRPDTAIMNPGRVERILGAENDLEIAREMVWSGSPFLIGCELEDEDEIVTVADFLRATQECWKKLSMEHPEVFHEWSRARRTGRMPAKFQAVRNS